MFVCFVFFEHAMLTANEDYDEGSSSGDESDDRSDDRSAYVAPTAFVLIYWYPTVTPAVQSQETISRLEVADRLQLYYIYIWRHLNLPRKEDHLRFKHDDAYSNKAHSLDSSSISLQRLSFCIRVHQ